MKEVNFLYTGSGNGTDFYHDDPTLSAYMYPNLEQARREKMERYYKKLNCKCESCTCDNK